ncbi:oxidoreductase NAD-binding domain-containing protein 1-like isoform X2 [Apostichopus japonicus]
MMSSHVERTAENFRQKSVSEAEVMSISDASESVKLLTLKVTANDFTFKAGQWVDFVVPGVERVGGFSMYTSPDQLTENGTLGLAVKKSEHQPAMWVHTKCTVGSKVSLRVGGDQLLYDPQSDSPSWNLLLIAGGIGINPIFSVLNRVCGFHRQCKNVNGVYKPGVTELLYSASVPNELIFRESISEMVKQHPNEISSKYFITRGKDGSIQELKKTENVIERRISEDDLRSSITRLNHNSLLCMVCGPPPMIDSFEEILQKQGIPKENILTEKWW